MLAKSLGAVPMAAFHNGAVPSTPTLRSPPITSTQSDEDPR